MSKHEVQEMINDFQQPKDKATTQQDVGLRANEAESQGDIENPQKSIETRVHDLIRIGFIRKVYGILSIQLIITVLLCCATFHPEIKKFVFFHTEIFWITMVLSFVVIIPLLCFRSLAKRVPWNYIFLFTWTLCEGYLVACCCSVYEPKIVVMAATATAVVTVSITLYACFTTTDVTFSGGLLFSCLSALILLTLFSFFLPFLHVLICILGVILYSIYLLYDTQLLIGKFGVEYDVDDYIIAALNIYLDIIQLFLYILEIVARLSSN